MFRERLALALDARHQHAFDEVALEEDKEHGNGQRRQRGDRHRDRPLRLGTVRLGEGGSIIDADASQSETDF